MFRYWKDGGNYCSELKQGLRNGREIESIAFRPKHHDLTENPGSDREGLQISLMANSASSTKQPVVGNEGVIRLLEASEAIRDGIGAGINLNPGSLLL